MFKNEMKFVPVLSTMVVLLLLVSCVGTTPAETSPTNTPEPAPEVENTPAPEPTQSTTDATSKWNPDPAQNIAITNLGGDQALPRIVTQDNGDFFIAWFSNPKSENYDVRMQKFDAQGNALWEENGRIVSDNKSDTWISDYAFTKDHEGNPILIFQDNRTGRKNIFAYKFSPDGQPLWGEDGLQMTNIDGFVAPFPATITTPDHVIFAYEGDLLNGGSALALQKITATGDKVWGEDGLILPGQEETPFIQANMVAGNHDEVILVYGIEKQEGYQIMSIYAQKLDRDGNNIWNGSEPILLHDSVPFYIAPQMVSDGANGVYIVWYTTDLQGFVQHIDADGNLLMPEAGAPLVTNTTNLQISPMVQYLPAQNELFVFWVDNDRDQRERGVSGQKMSSTGALLWGENGRNFVELSRAELNPVLPHLSGDNIVVFYSQGEVNEDSNSQDVRLKALLIDANGELVWPEPTILSSQLNNKRGLTVADMQDQNWVAVWGESVESDEGLNFNLFMQNLPINSQTP